MALAGLYDLAIRLGKQRVAETERVKQTRGRGMDSAVGNKPHKRGERKLRDGKPRVTCDYLV